MAQQQKKTFPKFISPKGVFKFPSLTEPDYGNKEFPKPNGVYKTGLVVRADDPAVIAFLAKLQPVYDAALQAGCEAFEKLKVDVRKKLKTLTPNPLFTTLYDKETEEETGEISFSFSMPASGIANKDTARERKWTAKPDLFDAKGRPMVKATKVWGGTVGKVSFEARDYFIPGTGAAGLSLRLKGAQIIELVSAGQRSAASHGFGEEEGYEYDENQFVDESTAGAGAAADDAAARDTADDKDF
jgi:hypothetical protein